ncbi:MAG: hypothetical protein ACTHJ8_00405 [Mucilaginibacter sp.]
MLAYKTMACWSDLLGFGDQFDQAGWSLDETTANLVGERPSRFASRIYEMAGGKQGSLFKYQMFTEVDSLYFKKKRGLVAREDIDKIKNDILSRINCVDSQMQTVIIHDLNRISC